MDNAVKILSTNGTKATVGGYGVVFGGVDLEGETFTPNTNFMLDLVPNKPVFYHHGQNASVQKSIIGGVTVVKADDIGLWIEAELEMSRQYVDGVLDLVKMGRLGWSSGSVTHLAEREGGIIKSWPIVEFSLTPTPAEPRTLGVERLKALAELDPALSALVKAAEESGAEAQAQTETPEITKSLGDLDMSEQKELGTHAVDLGPVLDAIKGLGEQVKAFDARLQTVESDNTPTNDPGPAGKAVNVVTDTEHWKYDNVATEDLAFTVGTLQSAKQNGRSRNGATVPAYKALAMRLETDEARRTEAGRVAAHALKSLPIKANEINQSTLANYGDEWVGVLYSGNLWESIRHETAIVSRIPSMEVPQGAESVVIPLESTDPTWYKVAQAASLSANPGGIPTNTVTASNLGTANQTLTLGKMGARVLWTGEMEEDAVLPYAPNLRRQLVVSGAEYLESAVIDGDTATGATTNINDIAGTPGGTEYWLIANGFRKLALVTNTANSRDGGSLTSGDFLETVKLMGVGGANADIMRTAFIIPSAVHFKALELADVKTRDVFSGATIENGRLAGIYGYPIYVSHHMHKAQTSRLVNTAGKVDLDTAGNNTTSAILAVRFDQWMFGWRRRMTIETTRVPAADSTEIVALMRWGMVYRDTEASAISYNLTV